MRTCLIFGAGDYYGLAAPASETDYIIAADGGYRYCVEAGLAPDLVIGDFDSLGYVPKGNVITVPVEKDDTDMELAAKKGLALPADRFILYGGTGGRPDHTLANLQLLQMLSRKGKSAFLIGDGICFTAVTNGVLPLAGGTEGTVSVFDFAENARGVSVRGMKYTLENGTLAGSVTLGVSNSLTGAPAEIEVKSGTLLVYAPLESIKPLLK